jgi:hypothetical protein
MDESDDETGKAASAMRTRTWSIATNFRKPSDYGIPTAPRFDAERRGDGALVLLGPDGATLLTAERPSAVRR